MSIPTSSTTRGLQMADSHSTTSPLRADQGGVHGSFLAGPVVSIDAEDFTIHRSALAGAAFQAHLRRGDMSRVMARGRFVLEGPGMNLQKSDFSGADLTGSNLPGVFAEEAIQTDVVAGPGSDFRGGHFEDAVMKGFTVSPAAMVGTVRGAAPLEGGNKRRSLRREMAAGSFPTIEVGSAAALAAAVTAKQPVAPATPARPDMGGLDA